MLSLNREFLKAFSRCRNDVPYNLKTLNIILSWLIWNLYKFNKLQENVVKLQDFKLKFVEIQ